MLCILLSWFVSEVYQQIIEWSRFQAWQFSGHIECASESRSVWKLTKRTGTTKCISQYLVSVKIYWMAYDWQVGAMVQEIGDHSSLTLRKLGSLDWSEVLIGKTMNLSSLRVNFAPRTVILIEFVNELTFQIQKNRHLHWFVRWIACGLSIKHKETCFVPDFFSSITSFEVLLLSIIFFLWHLVAWYSLLFALECIVLSLYLNLLVYVWCSVSLSFDLLTILLGLYIVECILCDRICHELIQNIVLFLLLFLFFDLLDSLRFIWLSKFL